MTGFWVVSYVALWALLLVIAVALLSVLRNLGVIYESLAASRSVAAGGTTKLIAGERLPELTLQTLAGTSINLSAFEGTKVAISVVSPHCSPCQALLHEIATGRGIVDPLDPTVRRRIVVSIGDIPATAELAEQLQLPSDIPLVIDAAQAIAERWGITATPHTVIVDEGLRVTRHVLGAPSAGTARRRDSEQLVGVS